MSNTQPQAASIVAVLVAGDEKIAALPQVFGVRYMMQAELLAHRWMRKLCEDYTGGDWDYYRTSNGGFFMAPKSAGKFTLAWAMEEAELSAQAAGIAVSLLAWAQLCNQTELDAHIELYHALRDFTRHHPDGSRILQLID